MKNHPESGNVIFFVLLAIVLIGLVTAALRSTGGGDNIDRETGIIRVSEVRQYASELERGITFIMQDGVSESDIRFASGAVGVYGAITFSSATQVFSELGGGVAYSLPPSDISTASHWEFYGNTHLPDVGTAAPELIAVLPNVTPEFCERINAMNGQTAQPDENGDCNINDTSKRFKTGTLFQDGGPNTVDEDPVTSFTAKPAMEGCIKCPDDSDPNPEYHFYHVLMAR